MGPSAGAAGGGKPPPDDRGGGCKLPTDKPDVPSGEIKCPDCGNTKHRSHFHWATGKKAYTSNCWKCRGFPFEENGDAYSRPEARTGRGSSAGTSTTTDLRPLRLPTVEECDAACARDNAIAAVPPPAHGRALRSLAPVPPKQAPVPSAQGPAPPHPRQPRQRLSKTMPRASRRDYTEEELGTEQFARDWTQALDHYKVLHGEHEQDCYDELPAPAQPLVEGEGGEQDTDADWTSLLDNVQRTLDEDDEALPSKLGSRDFDVKYDWNAHVGQHSYSDNAHARANWAEKMNAIPNELREESQSQGQAALLRGPQAGLYNLVYRRHFPRILAGESDIEQLLFNVDGEAGTGKSHAIKILSAHLQTLAGQQGKPIPIVRCAPTSVAANAIRGWTIHSLFQIHPDRQFTPLNDQDLRNVRGRFDGVHYLIIDEKSALGLELLGWIDNRLRQIRDRTETVFGGLSVILVGDFLQLPPVGQIPLYDTDSNLAAAVAGRTAYQALNQTVKFRTLFRQDENDAETEEFRRALQGLRHNNVLSEHFDLLATRWEGHIHDHDVLDRFGDATHIFDTNQQVSAHNLRRLTELAQPVIVINAMHSPANSVVARHAMALQAGNLYSTLCLSIGAQVMLLENIATSVGLVNGASGIIRDIAWPAGANPLTTMPACLFLEMITTYHGPTVKAGLNNEFETVAIFPTTHRYQIRKHHCSRTQFPIVLKYGLTVHKAQGMTLPSVALDISLRHQASHAAYVAISRVCSLQDLIFLRRLDFDDFHAGAQDRQHRMLYADFWRRRSEEIRFDQPQSQSDVHGQPTTDDQMDVDDADQDNQTPVGNDHGRPNAGGQIELDEEEEDLYGSD